MAQKLLKTKKSEVAPRKDAGRGTGIVLVGTYGAAQMEKWILPKGYYNYPVGDEDDCTPAHCGRIRELWLYKGKGARKVFSAEFIGVKTRAELPGYPATKAKPHGEKYLLFKVAELYGPQLEDAAVHVRVSDFAKRTPEIAAAVKAFQEGSKAKPETAGRLQSLGAAGILAEVLPFEVVEVQNRLYIREGALQLDLFFASTTTPSPLNNGGNTGRDNVDIAERVVSYCQGREIDPIFLCGDAAEVLRRMPESCIDCCMTSPPYWNKRQYKDGGIGLESDYHEFIDRLVSVFGEVFRVLKPSGSFWLNIGDSYAEKNLLNIPARIAVRMQDEQGWVLRNTVIWNKVKGCPDNSGDKLRNVYEPIFHFVKKPHGYFYNIDSIRNRPHQTKVVNGAIVSATGVSGVKYKRKIELSTMLSSVQKANALLALDEILSQVRSGEVSDFRMIILGEQRTTHSDSEKVSGRAKELHDKGFYFLKYNPKGSKPADLWDIIPEDTQGRESHFAPYPEDLCRMPIKLTCPKGGVVLDPFSGTGTTMVVARELGVKSIGIDISPSYISDAEKRIANRFAQQEFFSLKEE